MPDNYHISPATGKAAPCSASKRACRYGNSTHYSTLEEAQQAAKTEELKSSIDKKLSPRSKPIIVPKNPLPEPNINLDLQYRSGLDVVYDFYGHPDGVECSADEDDYCRDQEYENLRMLENHNLNVKSILAAVFAVSEEKIPDELVKFGESIGMDSSDAYDAVATGGYYGEEAEIVLNHKTKEALTDWYYSQDNARDSFGILDYCRSKGMPTAGLKPLDAIKAQLLNENKKVHPKVADAVAVETQTLFLNEVKVGNLSHYLTVEPTKPESLTGGDAITGIIVVPDRPRYYRNMASPEALLVDGYHRYKFAKTKGRSKGKFIVLFTKS